MRVLPIRSWLRYVVAIFAVIWLSSCVYLVLSNLNLLQREACDQCSAYEKTVDDLVIRVNRDSGRLRELLEALNRQESAPSVRQETLSKDAPFTSHEILRRRAIFYTQEIWNTISGQLGPLAKKLGNQSDVLKSLQKVQSQVGEITRLLEVHLHGLGRVDGAAERQIEGLHGIGQLLTKRLSALQNPRTSCSSARFLLASLNRPCAFGCNVHHLVYCFIFAYASGRTLLLVHGNDYSDWWMENFLPLSSQCSNGNLTLPLSAPDFTDETLHSQTKFLQCPYIGELYGANKLLPPAVPSDLVTALVGLHGAPFIWFAGHLLSYLMRPTASLNNSMSATVKGTALALPSNRRTPVVGVHIRRSDKINTEAQFHNVSEYMLHVERFFDMVDDERRMMSRTHEWQGDIKSPPSQLKDERLKPVPRQVYLATDDPKVLEEAKDLYPNYRFISDSSRAELASNLGMRSDNDAIFDIALDIIMMSKTDYLVCTFSSQVCRVAFELMQARDQELGDASWRYRSLDDGYYFGGQQGTHQETLVPHPEHRLAYGALVKIAGNHWDGFAKLENGHQGYLAPAYKFRPLLITAPMGGY